MGKGERGKGISLPQAPLSRKKPFSRATNNNREVGRREAAIDRFPLQSIESFPSQNIIKELPIVFIISFLQIQFDNHPLLLSSTIVLHAFISNKNAIKYVPPFNEGVLVSINHVMKNSSNSIR